MRTHIRSEVLIAIASTIGQVWWTGQPWIEVGGSTAMQERAIGSVDGRRADGNLDGRGRAAIGRESGSARAVGRSAELPWVAQHA